MSEPLRFTPPGKLKTMRTIAEGVAARHGVALKDLRGPSRTRHVSFARFEAYWLCRHEERAGVPRWSLPAIGRFFGGRDHTTVIHGIKRHEELSALREAAE